MILNFDPSIPCEDPPIQITPSCFQEDYIYTLLASHKIYSYFLRTILTIVWHDVRTYVAIGANNHIHIVYTVASYSHLLLTYLHTYVGGRLSWTIAMCLDFNESVVYYKNHVFHETLI